MTEDTSPATTSATGPATPSHGTSNPDPFNAEREAFRKRLLKAHVQAAAARSGFRDPTDSQLADLSEVRLGADDQLEGADAAFAALRQSKPYLFHPEDASSRMGTSHAGPAPKPGSIEARDVRHMSREEYARARDQFLRTYGR